jgi:hypothetical protein
MLHDSPLVKHCKSNPSEVEEVSLRDFTESVCFIGVLDSIF